MFIRVHLWFFFYLGTRGGAAGKTVARKDQGTDADESGAAKGHTTPLLIKTLQKHHIRMLESSQVIEEMIQMTKDM